MNRLNRNTLIFVAEDDLDDQLILKDAFEESQLSNAQRYFNNGVELIDGLRILQKDLSELEVPSCLILLDLNMPKMDGREALQIIKEDPILRRVPVIVFTTSKATEDIVRSYDLGACGYISKPVNYSELINVVNCLKHYWLELVELP